MQFRPTHFLTSTCVLHSLQLLPGDELYLDKSKTGTLAAGFRLKAAPTRGAVSHSSTPQQQQQQQHSQLHLQQQEQEKRQAQAHQQEQKRLLLPLQQLEHQEQQQQQEEQQKQQHLPLHLQQQQLMQLEMGDSYLCSRPSPQVYERVPTTNAPVMLQVRPLLASPNRWLKLRGLEVPQQGPPCLELNFIHIHPLLIFCYFC